MTERAKLLIEPGCEAGSKHCGECDKRIRTNTCHILGVDLYGLVNIEKEQIYFSEDDIKFYRCQECIEAEAKANVMREKIERLEEAIEYHKQVARYAKNKIKRQESKELVAVLMQILEPVK